MRLASSQTKIQYSEGAVTAKRDSIEYPEITPLFPTSSAAHNVRHLSMNHGLSLLIFDAAKGGLDYGLKASTARNANKGFWLG